MIGKISKGLSFRGVVGYAMNKKDAHLIDSEGVLTESKASIVSSFIAQMRLNERVKQPVEHIVLSYKKEDAAMLTDAKMAELAREYLREMKLHDTQFIVVRHNDRDHPHCHIILNRVGNDGRILSDKHERLQNMTVCKRLKEKHGLTFGENKAGVNLDRLRKPELAQHEIYHAVTAALKTAHSWRELRKELERKGITMEYKFKGHTQEVQGLNFSKDGFTFKGSQIDRNYSYSKLDARFRQGQTESTMQNHRPEPAPKVSPEPHSHSHSPAGSGLFDLTPHGELPYEETVVEAEERRKKKRKKQKII